MLKERWGDKIERAVHFSNGIDTDFFKDSIEVTLDYFFKGVDLYYTLDGSEPDTTSTRYNAPIVLTASTLLKAVSHKPGWELSPVKTVSFKKSNIPILIN